MARVPPAAQGRPATLQVRRRTVIIVAAVLLAATTALAFLYAGAGAERDRATAQRDFALSRQLIAQSQALAGTSPQTARLLAVAAARIVPASAETRAAVRVAAARPQLAVLRGFPGEVYSVAFDPGGATLAAAGHDAPLRLWDVTRLAPVSWPVGESRGDGMSVAYSPDGGHLAVAEATGRVRVWDTGTRRAWTGGEQAPWARQWASFSPDGDLLATAGGTSRLWEAASGRQVAALRSLEGDPGPVAFSPDGTLIAAAYPGGPIRTFEARTGRLTGDPLTPAAGSVRPEPREEVAALAFSPGGRLLAGTTGSEHVQLWDVVTRQTSGRPLTGHAGLVTSAAFSPDGGILATGSQDGTIRLWDVRSHRPLGEPLTGHTNAVNAVAFSPDGGVLASASADATVRLWHVPAGARRPLTLPGKDGIGEVPADRPIPPRWYEHPDTTQAVLSADAGRLIVQPYEANRAGAGTVWSWDLRARGRRGERLRIRPDDLVDGVALSRDGRSLAASGLDDAGRGLNTAVLGGPDSIRGRPLTYSADGRLLATDLDGAVRIWRLPGGGTKGGPLAGHPGRVTAAAFDDGGALLAVGTSAGEVLLWEVATGRRRATLRGHTLPVTSLAFAPGGDLLLSGGEDRTARLWNVAAARPHGPALTGHTGQVRAVAVSPDGTYLATGGQDRAIRLWDTATGQALGPPLAGHGGEVRALAFTADGKTLVAAATDLVQVTGDSYAVWKWDTAELATDPAATACAQAARPLTREEWAAHVPALPYRDVCRP